MEGFGELGSALSEGNQLFVEVLNLVVLFIDADGELVGEIGEVIVTADGLGALVCGVFEEGLKSGLAF